MSHDINCPECNYANTPGSKFCNNCGSKLPLSTHIICPNCTTPNTRDRVFCDHCGSRLIPEEPPQQKEEPDVQEPAAGSGAFTLPTRKPGETGELDPSTLPDWLRSAGKRAKDEKDAGEDAPRIEDIQSETGQTADLPEWLVHDSDPEPIINAPTTISTEFFMDLVDKADDLPDIDELELGQDDELMADAENANLPDWLSEADTIPDITDQPEQSLPNPEEIFSDIPDSDILKSVEQPTSPAKDESTPDWLDDSSSSPPVEEEGITHWLSDLEETTDGQTNALNDDEESGLTDWLADIDEDENDEVKVDAAPPTVTDLFSDSESTDGDWLNAYSDSDESSSDVDDDDWFGSISADEPTDVSASLPEPDESDDDNDWFGSFADDDTSAAADDEPVDVLTASFPEPDESDDDDDWLSSFADDDTSATADDEPADGLTASFPEPDESDDDDDWLSSFADDDTSSAAADEPTDGLTASFPEPDESDDDDDDWLSSFADDDTSSAAADEPTDGLTASFPEPDESDDDDDWLSSFTDDDTSSAAADEHGDVLTASFPEPDASDDDEDNWLSSFTDDDNWVDGDSEEEPDTLVADRINDLFGDSGETVPSSESTPPEWDTITDEQFDTLFEDEQTPEETLPDWLSAAEQDSKSLISQEDDVAFTGSLASTQGLVENAETDWLADLDGIEVPELSEDFLGIEEEESVADHLTSPLAADEHESDPDWLSDLSALDTGQLILDAEADMESFEEPIETPPEPVEQLPSEEPIQPVTPALESVTEDDSFLNMDEDGIMPDWMSQLDEASSDALADAPPPLANDEELPDWIANMRPGENSIASDLGGSLSSFETDIPETLEGLPTDLAGGDLPDWLMEDQGSPSGSAIPSFGEPSLDENPEIPDWLKADDGGEASPGDGDGDDWVSMLDELPPSVPVASTLALAEMPEWVEELRPSELDQDASSKPPIPEGPEETEGPLAGLRGVIAIEAAVVQPHPVDPVQTFTVTPEQQEQVALLQQITHEESPQRTIVGTGTQGAIAPWLRLILALLLIGIIVVGLLGLFPLAKKSFTTVPPPVMAMEGVVNDTESTPVLVAFEYTPSLKGELSPQAATLLAQFAAQERDILTISQYPSGTAIAEEIGSQSGIMHLGYLPGNAIGLRQLSDCLMSDSGCSTLAGHSIDQETRQLLSDVGLIVVLTGNKDSLTNWIEQVGGDDEVMMSAGVTTALAPAAAPYFATGQLSGYLAGMLDTAVYQDLSDGNIDQDVNKLLNAQLLGQLLTAIILLLGLIIYGVRGLSKRGNK